MSENVEDPTGEVLDRTARITLTTAALAGRQVAEALRQQQAQREAAELDESRRLQERWDSNRAAARASLASTGEAWMQQATPEQAAEAWMTAHAYAAVDPTFRADEERLRDGIRDRWGVDVAVGGDETSLRREADVEQSEARAAERDQTADELTAGGILAGTAEEIDALEDADRQRGNAETHEAAATSLDASADAVAYDSDERRQALADRARGAGVDEDTVAGRVVAADANAEPVRNATRKGRGSTKARRRGAASQRTRTDQLSR